MNCPASVLVVGLLYAFLTPATVNGDGVGYLAQVGEPGLSPGHLAYLPLIRGVADVWGYEVLMDLATPLRGLSILCAVLALAFLYDAGRRVHGTRPALFATALLALSYGYSRSAMQVEVYAPAVLMVVATLWALVRYAGSERGPSIGWAALAGVFAGGAFLYHLTLILLAPSVVVLLVRWGAPDRRYRRAALCLGVMGVVILAPLLAALHRQGITDVAGAWGWLAGADHGIPYPRPLLGPVVALWGICRSLVFVPYAYEAPIAVVAVLTAVGGAAWLFLLRLGCRATRPAASLLDGRFVLIWSVPLTLFAILFYPSDTERWIFILPAVFLWLAPVAGRPAFACLALIAAVNLFAGHLPEALDTEARDRAAAVDRVTTARDLVVSPGHGWEELVGLSVPAPPRIFPLIFHVGALEGRVEGVRRMLTEIDRTLAEGGRVFVARLRGSDDPRGFKELEWFGMSREDFEKLFLPYEPVETTVPGLWRLTRRDN